MPPNAVPPDWDWTCRTEPDQLPELMDEPCGFEDLRACLYDLGRVNRLTLGYRPTLHFLDRIIAANKPTTPLRILDVGSGGGDALHRIAQWAKSKNIAVALTGIDLNPNAALIAKASFGDTPIQWLTGDALEYRDQVDVVICSLLTHHLPTPAIIRFVQYMEQAARLGWFINDLERSPRSANLFATLARIMRWHRFVQHDGPVSFARAFTPNDWQRTLAESGLASDAAQVARAFPSRLCVSRLK